MPQNLLHPFALRLDVWIRQMQASKPCDTRQKAYDLALGTWLKVNQELGASAAFLQALRRRRLCEEHGWSGLDTEVAHWDLDDAQTVRLYLHSDGSIVVQQLDAQNLQILFTLPGLSGRLGELSVAKA